MKNIRKERGVALLFALGIMSLMLVTGMAFLANSLVSQKISVNNSSQTQSKLLGLSAAHRGMFALSRFLNFYADDVRGAYDTYMPNVCSSVSSNGTNDTLASKLSVKLDGADYYNGSSSNAQWIYIHNDGSDSDGLTNGKQPIIGRYAFQMLPQQNNSSGRLSLFAVTRGATMEAGKGEAYYSSSATTRVPQLYRWGMDGDELNFSKQTLFPLWAPESSASPVKEFDTMFGILAYPATTIKGKSYSAGPLYSASDSDNTANQKKKHGVRYWFTEGKGRISPEAYWDGSSWRHRFNISEMEGPDGNLISSSDTTDRRWYQRLLSGTATDPTSIKNTGDASNDLTATNALNALAAPAAEYKPSDVTTTDKRISGVYSGLPFLRRISHKKGSFSSLELRRKQIAANLNDYCDADDVPTSDAVASTWTTDSVWKERTNRPSFTGNEKTPYINEVGLQVCLATTPANGSGKFSSQKVKATVKVTPKMLIELIDIYGGLGSCSPAVKMAFSNLKITLRLQATCSFNYSYTEDSTSKSGSCSGVVVSTEGTTSDFNGEFYNKTAVLWGKPTYANGYITASSAFGTGTGSTGGNSSLTIDLSDALAEKTGHSSALSSISNFTFTKLALAVTKVEFNISDVVLYKKDTTEAWDYVKMPSELISVSCDKLPPEYPTYARDLFVQNGSKESVVDSDNDFQYLGGMEARDPRQNLNIIKADANSDWYWAPQLGTKSVLSMNFSTTEEQKSILWGLIKWTVKTDEALSGGVVNNSSKPNAPWNGIGTAMTSGYDSETVTDPAATSGTEESPRISTAVIRNAPMKSPWELGFISRGEAFQTINLKKTGGFFNQEGTSVTAQLHATPSNWDDAGTKYSEGDGGLLDEIKMTDHVKSFGKINLNMFEGTSTLPAGFPASDVAAALFEGVRTGQTATQFLTESGNKDFPASHTFAQTSSGATGTALSSYGSALAGEPLTALQYRSLLLNNANANGILTLSSATPAPQNDAGKEELIGKVINLTDTRNTSGTGALGEQPNVFRFVVVAQTIRQQPDGIKIPARNADGTLKSDGTTITYASGKRNIDSTSGWMYDDIMGEVKMLVTVERISYFDVDAGKRVPRARLRIRQIEYLD